MKGGRREDGGGLEGDRRTPFRKCGKVVKKRLGLKGALDVG